jgi:hypothetical protein
VIWERSQLLTQQPMTEADWLWFEPLVRHLPPAGFVVRPPGFRRVADGLGVIISGRTEGDGRRWVHVSASHVNRTPTWEKMCEVKRLFLGPDRRAIQVHPPDTEWVSLHPYCLHLWCCIDDDGLPDFRLDEGRQI